MIPIQNLYPPNTPTGSSVSSLTWTSAVVSSQVFQLSPQPHGPFSPQQAKCTCEHLYQLIPPLPTSH